MKDDQAIEKELREKAEIIDGTEIHVPEFAYFKELVDRQAAAARRAQRRELALFVAVACVLLTGILMLMGRFEVFFIALQCAALAGAVTGLAVFFHRTRSLKAGAR